VALLGVPLVAATATVVLTAVPAHAALAYQGTFTIKDFTTGQCVQVENNGTTDKTPIVRTTCDGSAAQRWAIYLETSLHVYWILAYGGQQPLNKCMDKGDSDHIWIFGCHGGSQQRWDLIPNTTDAQPIRSLWNTSLCLFPSPTLVLAPCTDVTRLKAYLNLIPA
jgi:hypothetical protein